MLSVVGETLDDKDEICGCVYSKRMKGDRIAVWFKSGHDQDMQIVLGARLLSFLNLVDTPDIGNLKQCY